MTDKNKQNNQRELVKDVVCGMLKPKSKMPASSKYKGKAYYFCTEGDKEMFEANPEHWIPKEEGGEGKKE